MLVGGNDEIVAPGHFVILEVTRIIGVRFDWTVCGNDQDTKRLHPLMLAARKVQDLLEDPLVTRTIPRSPLIIDREVTGVRLGVTLVRSRLDVTCQMHVPEITLNDTSYLYIYASKPCFGAWRPLTISAEARCQDLLTGKWTFCHLVNLDESVNNFLQ